MTDSSKTLLFSSTRVSPVKENFNPKTAPISPVFTQSICSFLFEKTLKIFVNFSRLPFEALKIFY